MEIRKERELSCSVDHTNALVDHTSTNALVMLTFSLVVWKVIVLPGLLDP